MPRAVIYARFSSDMQREESIDAQVRACTAYAKSKGYEIVDTYIDEAKSGREVTKRDAYKKMLDDASHKKFDIVIFHKIDRNSRNEVDYYITKAKFLKLGISYEYAVQSIDSSPEGQMMEGMLVAIAAYYSRNLSKEAKKGLNENAYKAQFNGGTPPLGYKIVDKHYVIDNDEAEAIRLIFNLFISGHSYKDICCILASKGYTTRNGKNFGKNSLYDIIGNERYCGIYTFNKIPKDKGKRNSHSKKRPDDFIRIEDAIPAIISKDVFKQAQDRRRINKARPAFKAKTCYLLSGKIICGQCGQAMGGHSVSNHQKVYTYYSCLTKERVPMQSCPQRTVRKYDTENAVLDKIKAEILTPQTFSSIADKMRKKFATQKGSLEKDIANKQVQLNQAQKKRANLYKLVEKGLDDDFTLAQIKAAKDNIESLQEDIEKLKKNKKSKILTDAEINKAFKLFNDKLKSMGDIEAKKLLIDLFLDKVIVTGQKLDIQLSTDAINNMIQQ